MLECVPEDKFSWKPHAKSMTLGRLASHVAEMALWGKVALTTDKLELTSNDKPLNATTRAELLAALDSNAADSKKAIAAVSDADMMKPWSLVVNGQTILTQPRVQVLRGMVISHLIHHRGQLSVYLRLLDVPIPGMYGPSADQ